FIFEELEEGEVVYIRGIMGSGIRMFFVHEIVSLSKLKLKIEKEIPLNETERLLVKPNFNKLYV
ncbi:MAG: hypothetical protein AABY22_05990, partial [Nanoarchaeota archaeon]